MFALNTERHIGGVHTKSAEAERSSAARGTLTQRSYNLLAGAFRNRKAKWLRRKKVAIRAKFVGIYGFRVLQGPFAGLQYLDAASGSEYLPKLVGSYESELHPLIDKIANSSYESIVDVGCAEGYYAVGFARRCPSAAIFAFDIDPVAQKRCLALAQINGVEGRVSVNSEFSGQSMNEIPGRRRLVICDCEGGERELFAEEDASTWVGVDLLIECHTNRHADIPMAIASKLGATHEIQLFDSTVRTGDYPSLWFLKSATSRRLAVDESRSPMQWIWAKHREDSAK